MIGRCMLGLLVLMSLCPFGVQAHINKLELGPDGINTLIAKEVKEPFSYSGLAAFYNSVTTYIVTDGGIEQLDDERFYPLTDHQALAVVGHHKILLIEGPTNAAVSALEGRLSWQEGQNGPNKAKFQAQLLLKSDLAQLPSSFQKLRYAHLWWPFRLLCLWIEVILLWLHSLNLGWGIAIIVLSLLFKIFILPANIILIRSQRKVSHVQASLAPKLQAIKANFKGEQAHQKLMAAYKKQGVTPFYALKPLLLTLLPVPFLIAIFNVLGELDPLAGHSFLWIKDLAYPDAVLDLGVHIPLLGSSINLLPILMTMLTIFAARFHRNKIIGAQALYRQKLNLYLMAFGFLILFYPFPSAMVLYWTFANLWQLIQQRFLRV